MTLGRALVRSPAVVLDAFLAGLVVSIVGLVIASVRGVGLWRQAKTTGGVLTAELAEFDARSARTERLLAEWEQSSAELERAVARLRVSRAQLEVLLGTVEAAERRVRWLRLFMPVR
jgi:hypothetical protein